MSALLLLSFLCWQQAAPAEQAPDAETLTNAAVVELVRAGMADPLVLQLIENRDSAFDVSVQSLIELRKSGVSNALIRSMLAASVRRAAGTGSGSASATVPDEQGVYWEGAQGPQRLPAENVTLRGPRGFETDTGAIQGVKSTLALTPPLTFVIRTPDDVSPDEYVLLQLFIRKDRREFRTLMGSLWRGDGLERMAVPFESERLAPNVYRLRVVALPKGEFGFVRPGSAMPIAEAANRPESEKGLIVPARPGTKVPMAGVRGDGGQPGSSSPSAAAIFTFSVR